MTRAFGRFFYSTWYGAALCWIVVAGATLALPVVAGERMVWLQNSCAVLFAIVSLLAVTVLFVNAARGKWLLAGLQLTVGLMLFAVFLFALVCTSFHCSIRDFREEDQTWRASEVSVEIPFSIEFRRSHPFQGEYDRRIVFRSGKKVGLWPDCGGAREFAVYGVGTNVFFLIDSLNWQSDSSRYRVNVETETVETKTSGAGWVRVPDGAISICSMSIDEVRVKTEDGEAVSTERIRIGDSLKNKKYVGRIFPSGEVRLGGEEPVLQE